MKAIKSMYAVTEKQHTTFICDQCSEYDNLEIIYQRYTFDTRALILAIG